eukprot:4643503-Amphidinium_carterae.1
MCRPVPPLPIARIAAEPVDHIDNARLPQAHHCNNAHATKPKAAQIQTTKLWRHKRREMCMFQSANASTEK